MTKIDRVISFLFELFFTHFNVCICTRKCDCEYPHSEEGIAYFSNECPIHNTKPQPNPACMAKKHWFE